MLSSRTVQHVYIVASTLSLYKDKEIVAEAVFVVSNPKPNR